MIIHSLSSRHEFTAGDGTTLRELLHGPKDGLPCSYSLAHARLAPGQASFLHRLATSEVYYILAGRGRMDIDGEVCEVSEGDTIYIPPEAAQRITNSGSEELAFLCIVDPAWREEDEKVIESK
jgi:mannose-6-phosphate isomerase-like protein (cupin superfamily)